MVCHVHADLVRLGYTTLRGALCLGPLSTPERSCNASGALIYSLDVDTQTRGTGLLRTLSFHVAH